MVAIEVFTKNNFKDSKGQHILSDINLIGVNGVKRVKYCSLYIVEGDLLPREVKMISSSLLSDGVTEEYTVTKCYAKDSCSKTVDISEAMIEVLYKKGVTDTVSSSVIKAVRDLGINKEMEIRTGSRYYVSGNLSKSGLESISKNLLANTLIQEYKIEIIK